MDAAHTEDWPCGGRIVCPACATRRADVETLAGSFVGLGGRATRNRFAEAVLESDWLAAREVEAGRQALRDAADDLPDYDTLRAGGDAAMWLRARAEQGLA